MDKQSKASWYGAKAVFIHDDLSMRQGRPCFEERIVLVRAEDDDHALRLAATEARRYAKESGEARYLDYLNVFSTSDTDVSVGTEVFSIMRSMNMSEKDFLDKYYDDGSFHTRRSVRPSKGRRKRGSKGSALRKA